MGSKPSSISDSYFKNQNICQKEFKTENLETYKHLNSSSFYPLLIQVLFTSDNLFWGDKNKSTQNELSYVNKTYIDINNGQKFEL